MLDKQTRTLIAQRLNQAEKQREQIRAISLDYPSITIEAPTPSSASGSR